MKTAVTRSASADAEKQLKSFVDKFEPKNRALIRAVRKAMQKRLPTANELVYDNYNFFVIGYCSTERPSDCIVSVAAAANGVGLSFYRGASLPDPHKILLGSGNQNRFIRLGSVEILGRPEVEALIDAAVAQSAGERRRKAHHPLNFSEAEAPPIASGVTVPWLSTQPPAHLAVTKAPVVALITPMPFLSFSLVP